MRLPPFRAQRRGRLAAVDRRQDGTVIVVVELQMRSGAPLEGKPESFMTFRPTAPVVTARRTHDTAE